MTAKNLSEFKVQKFVLHNGRVFDIPAKLEAAPVDTPASSSPRTVSEPTKSTDSCSVSSNVLYSEREMLLAIITCMYIIKFKDAGCQVVQCVHHSEVALPSFSHVIEHLVSNHIKEDYTCFMCPFRRKDANSLVKHMASSHHMSVDRIQRLKEKIKVNLNISKLTDSKKLNFASVCLRATDQIIAVLNSSRDGRGSESLVDDSNILKESSALDKLQLSPEVKSPKCFFSSRDLVLALIDCLGVLKFHARPKTYQPNSNYVAECLVHRSEQMDGLQNIIHHVTAEHLRVTYGCFLCGVLAHSLEYLAEHLIRMHGLDVRKILSMKDVIRSSLLKKGSITDSAIRESAHTAGSRSSGMTSAAVMRGIPCPRCGKKCTTFKRITKHLTESHLVRPLLATRLVERLRTRMQRKEQKCKAEQMEVANKLVQTKSGRIIRKISEVNSDGDATKDSMFGLEDIKCMICGRSYPTTWSALAHITKVHKKTTKEGRKYISQPALSLKPVTHYHNAETMKPDDNCKEDKADASHRLRRSVNKSDDTDRSSTVSLFGADDLPCKICLKSFPKRAGLVDHYMRHHNMSRGEVYDLLQHLNTRKKAANSKSQTTEPQAENKRKQSSPRKCESNAITQKSSSDDSTSDMSLEGSHNKTLKTEEESLKMDSSPTGGPSFLQENNHSKKSSNSKDAAVKHNKVPSTTVVNSVGEPLGSQSAIPEQTDDTLLSSETNSNQPTKALHRCVDCSKFFSGSEVVTDSRNPLCKKCQKPVTS